MADSSNRFIGGEADDSFAGQTYDEEEELFKAELKAAGWILGENDHGHQVARAVRGDRGELRVGQAPPLEAGPRLNRSLPVSRVESSFSVLNDLSMVMTPAASEVEKELRMPLVQKIKELNEQPIVQADVLLSPKAQAHIFLALEDTKKSQEWSLSLLNSFYPESKKASFVVNAVRMDLEKLLKIWNQITEDERKFVEQSYLTHWMQMQITKNPNYDPRTDAVLYGRPGREVVLSSLFPGNNICRYLSMTDGKPPGQSGGTAELLLDPAVYKELLSGSFIKHIEEIPSMLSLLGTFGGRSLEEAARMCYLIFLDHSYGVVPNVMRNLNLEDGDDAMEADTGGGNSTQAAGPQDPEQMKAELTWIFGKEFKKKLDDFTVSDSEDIGAVYNDAMLLLKAPKITLDRDRWIWEANWRPSVVAKLLLDPNSGFYKKRLERIVDLNIKENRERFLQVVTDFVRSKKYTHEARVAKKFWQNMETDFWTHVDHTRVFNKPE